jgi:hypothetical protein
VDLARGTRDAADLGLREAHALGRSLRVRLTGDELATAEPARHRLNAAVQFSTTCSVVVVAVLSPSTDVLNRKRCPSAVTR